MIRLLYVSQASARLTPKDTQAILEASRSFNPTVGITGVLVHGGGLFMQVLEEPEHAVLRIYTKLLDDKRHADCRVVQISPTDESMFGNWSMGQIECDPLGIQHVNDLMAHRLESVQVSAFTSTMRDFLRRLNAGRKPAMAAASQPERCAMPPRRGALWRHADRDGVRIRALRHSPRPLP